MRSTYLDILKDNQSSKGSSKDNPVKPHRIRSHTQGPHHTGSDSLRSSPDNTGYSCASSHSRYKISKLTTKSILTGTREERRPQPVQEAKSKNFSLFVILMKSAWLLLM